MRYVASKLSFDQKFVFYAKGDVRAPAVEIGSVVVRGRQNVRDPHTLVMPTSGAITEVTDEDAARLVADPMFADYRKNGMMEILNTGGDAKRAAKDLAEKDGAAQLTESDFKKKGRRAPKAVRKSSEDTDDAE